MRSRVTPNAPDLLQRRRLVTAQPAAKLDHCRSRSAGRPAPSEMSSRCRRSVAMSNGSSVRSSATEVAQLRSSSSPTGFSGRSASARRAGCPPPDGDLQTSASRPARARGHPLHELALGVVTRFSFSTMWTGIEWCAPCRRSPGHGLADPPRGVGRTCQLRRGRGFSTADQTERALWIGLSPRRVALRDRDDRRRLASTMALGGDVASLDALGELDPRGR